MMHSRKKVQTGLALTALLLAAPALFAHPHVFITSKVSLQVATGEVRTISVSWTFDELFSEMEIADFDKGKKGSFTAQESAALKRGAFDNLKNYHYFLALFVDGKQRELPRIEGFTPKIEEGRLIYSFSLPLDLPIPSSGCEIRLTIYDDTYYVAFDKMSPSDVGIEGDGSASGTIAIVKTKVKAEWPGQFMPDQILIRLAKGSSG
jgi:nickel/cobalt transporter (NicO) family protein